MRALPEELLQKVRDLDAEGLLGRIPLPMVEKDIHLTDVLARLSTLEVRHAHFKGLLPGQTAVDDGIKLIFCGGTSLSKAHGIIERMSEDVDIKVVLTEPDHTIDIGQNRHRQPKMLKSDVGARARLKALHAHLLALFQDMDLALHSPFNERTNPHVRDSHRYLAAHVQYDNRLGTSQAIRPALKIEMIHRHPRLDLDTCQFGYLHERVAGLPSTLPAPVQMQCVGLAETIAEKTISLLRRAHWNWSGGQDKPLDPTLVRHRRRQGCRRPPRPE